VIPGTVPSGYAVTGNPHDNVDHTAHGWTQHDLPQHNFIPGNDSDRSLRP
jgi:hypothetical protein